MRSTIEQWSSTILAGAWLLSACSDSDSKREPDHAQDTASERIERFVGEVAGSDTRVAIVTDDASARVFFCGGERSVSGATHWFNVERAGDDLQVDDRDFALVAHFSGEDEDAVSGEVTDPDGITRAFSSQRVDPATIAGLYEGTGECGRLGLIVSQTDADAEISAQGACVSGQSGTLPKQVNPIRPIALTDGEVAVQEPNTARELALSLAQLTPL